MKICIARIFYNEKAAIEKTHPRVNAPVLYFDGRFPDFAKINDSDFSTDGSVELIDTYKNARSFQYAGYITDKLTYMFQTAGKEGLDALLLLSCDEWIEGDWDLFCKNLEELRDSGDERKLLNVPFKVLSGDSRDWMKAKPRLFINPSGFSVREKHWKYYYDGEDVTDRATTAPMPDIEGITILHDNRIRPADRDKLMDDYQKIPSFQRDAAPPPPRPSKNKRILRQMGLIP